MKHIVKLGTLYLAADGTWTDDRTSALVIDSGDSYHANGDKPRLVKRVPRVVHLADTRGEIVCGAVTGLRTVDIYNVTCVACDVEHTRQTPDDTTT